MHDRFHIQKFRKQIINILTRILFQAGRPHFIAVRGQYPAKDGVVRREVNELGQFESALEPPYVDFALR